MLIALLIMDFHYLEMVSVVRARMQALTTAPRMQALTTAPRMQALTTSPRMQALTTAPRSPHRYGERRPRTQAGLRASLHLRALHRTLRLPDQGARGPRRRLHARVLGTSQGGDSTSKGSVPLRMQVLTTTPHSTSPQVATPPAGERRDCVTILAMMVADEVLAPDGWAVGTGKVRALMTSDDVLMTP